VKREPVAGSVASFLGVRRLDAALPLTALTISIAGTIANRRTDRVAQVYPPCPGGGRERSEGRAPRRTCLAFHLNFQLLDLQLPLLAFTRDRLHVTTHRDRRLQSNVCATIRPMQPPRTFAEFWPCYVLAHRHPITRIFHSAGTLLGWGFFFAALATRRYWFLVAALIAPYALAWFSHFFVEHNRPATFGHPLWSWLADQKMVGMALVGKMDREVNRCAALDSATPNP
jgi:hypothetical protein